MNNIEIFNETNENIEELKTIEKLLNYAIEHEKLNTIIQNFLNRQ